MKENIIEIRPDNPAGIRSSQLYIREFRNVYSTEEFVFDFSDDFTSGYLILFFKNGQGIIVTSGRYRYFNQDHVLILKAGERFKVSNYNCAYYILQVDGPMVEKVFEPLVDAEGKEMIHVINPQKLKVVFSRIETSLQSDYMPYKLTSHIFSMLSEISKVKAEEVKHQNEDLISKAIAYIEEKFSEDLHVDEIAKVANLSKYYFTKEFKKNTGMTPIQYLIRKRINHAEFLLENTNQSVFQISAEAGFNTEVNFFYHFKRANNCTPKDYRKLHRNQWT